MTGGDWGVLAVACGVFLLVLAAAGWLLRPRRPRPPRHAAAPAQAAPGRALWQPPWPPASPPAPAMVPGEIPGRVSSESSETAGAGAFPEWAQPANEVIYPRTLPPLPDGMLTVRGTLEYQPLPPRAAPDVRGTCQCGRHEGHLAAQLLTMPLADIGRAFDTSPFTAVTA